MTTYLLFDDSLRSPEMRHEIGERVMDPVLFLEHGGKRIVVAGVLEQPLFESRDDIVDDLWNEHDLGMDELYKEGAFPEALLGPELVLRALRRAGVSSVTVPPSFKLLVADYLRSKGVEVVVDADVWGARRRRKTPGELEGIERAQRAVETAMLTAARMLREAEPVSQGRLRFEGEILTAEWIREAMTADLLSQGAESEDIIVHSGEACLRGHDIGRGPIAPDQPCIIDCYPRDRRSGVFSDMTRTFVPGEPSGDVRRLHEHCRRALDIAFESMRPGRDEVYRKVVEYFDSQGFPTYDNHPGPGPLKEGFFHAVGHGVGLEVHEKPALGRRSDELLEGDVVAVEPGLYFSRIGGVRLEDTVLVTAEGAEHFTDPYPYDLEP